MDIKCVETTLNLNATMKAVQFILTHEDNDYSVKITNEPELKFTIVCRNLRTHNSIKVDIDAPESGFENNPYVIDYLYNKILCLIPVVNVHNTNEFFEQSTRGIIQFHNVINHFGPQEEVI